MLLASYSDRRGAFAKDAALTSDELGSECWSLLYNRLGDSIFGHLLQRCSMFRFVSGFNFLQLSGPLVPAKNIKIQIEPLTNSASKIVEQLSHSRDRAESDLKDHKNRLEEWKKRKRQGEPDEGVAEIVPLPEDPPPAKQRCPYPLTYVTLQRYLMYYKHPKKTCFGLPVGWKGLQWKADEDGAKALASWIFGTTEDYLPRRAVNSLYLFRGILKRLKRLHFKSILEATCPLPKLDASGSEDESNAQEDVPVVSRSVHDSVVTQTASKPSQIDPPSSFMPHPSQLLFGDFPHMASSGVPEAHQSRRNPAPPQHTLINDSMLPETQGGLESSLEPPPTMENPFFDYKNEGDYLLHLLIEPAPNPVADLTLPELLPLFCKHHQISRFVFRIIRALIPTVGFGTEENWKLLELKIAKFVSLNRFDTISTCALLEGFQITQIPWLASNPQSKGPYNAEELSLRTKIFHAFLLWIFESVIMPLLGTTFYITETMMHRNQMFFYRREVWTRINTLGFETLISRGVLRAVSLEDAKSALKKRELGSCHIRFLPKKNGVRPIVNMKKTHSNPERPEPRSINSFLKPIHSILTFEAHSSPKNLLASSLLTNDDVHRKLLSFKRRLLQLPPDAEIPANPLPMLPKLYFVKTDIISAFDEVNQELLMKILEDDVVAAERYLAVLTTKVKIERERLRYHVLRGFTQDGPERHASLTEIVDEQSRKQSNSVLAKNMRMGFADRSSMLAILREHITRHLIRFNGKYFLQRCGIPQGSTLSSLLCSLYFAHLEKNKLATLLEDAPEGSDGVPRTSVLLRWIDDFLFISTDKAAAVRFFEVMHAGFEEYGTRCNPTKSQVNFDLRFGEADISNVSTQPHTQYNAEVSEGPSTSGLNEMIWCGWLINTRTLELRRAVPDGVIASQLISNNLSTRPGHSISEKLYASLRNAIFPLLFDPRFNPRHVLLESSFDVACYTALRLVALERGSYIPNSATSKTPRKLVNHKFLVDLIISLIQRFCATIKKKSSSYKRGDLVYECPLHLNDITMTSLLAFKMMLSRHLPLFQPVVEKINALIAENSTRINNKTLQEYHKAAANRFPKFAGAVF